MSLLMTLGALGVVVGAIAFVLAVAAWFRLARLRREFAALRRRLAAEASAEAASPRGPGSDAHEAAEGTRRRPDPPSGRRSETGISGFDPHAIRSVAMVRYDALQEMAGRLSFSLALLSADGDGVVVSSINGRTETRTYAKVIRGGEPTHPLSPEEERAVREARLGQASENGSLGRPHSSSNSAVPPLRPGH